MTQFQRLQKNLRRSITLKNRRLIKQGIPKANLVDPTKITVKNEQDVKEKTELRNLYTQTQWFENKKGAWLPSGFINRLENTKNTANEIVKKQHAEARKKQNRTEKKYGLDPQPIMLKKEEFKPYKKGVDSFDNFNQLLKWEERVLAGTERNQWTIFGL